MPVVIGDVVIMHLAAGDFPAMVTRVNNEQRVDDEPTLNLTVFMPGDIVYRDSVAMFVAGDVDDEDERIGTWNAR